MTLTTTTTKEEIVYYKTLDKLKAPQSLPRKYEYVYANIIKYAYLHLAGFYGLYLCFTSGKWATIALACVFYVVGEIGVTAGAHRLWCHRSFQAKMPLQIILIAMNSVAMQGTAFSWARDHRLHHKYSDTDADPHNPARGLFYAHMGWMFVKKHPEVIKRGQHVDISDMYANSVLMFQQKYALPVFGIFGYLLQTVIAMYCWGESLNCAWHITICRFIINMHAVLLVNSAAHNYGYRPYDKTIMPAQNLVVAVMTLGEGFHNYHHAFPWDYRTAELGNNWCNLTTWFIDFFAWIGWAYNLKLVPEDVIKKRMDRNGDGTGIWGWGDKEQTKENRDKAHILYSKS